MGPLTYSEREIKRVRLNGSARYSTRQAGILVGRSRPSRIAMFKHHSHYRCGDSKAYDTRYMPRIQMNPGPAVERANPTYCIGIASQSMQAQITIRLPERTIKKLPSVEIPVLVSSNCFDD